MPATMKAKNAGAFKLLAVDDMTGGLDLRHSKTLLKPNRASLLRNFSLREPGALSMVSGWRTFSSASLGAGRPQGGQRIYLGSATPFTLAAWNGGVYKPSDAGVWGAAVSTGWSTTTEMFFPFDRDIVAIFDATTAAKKSVNGTTWTTFGIAPPGTPTGANLAGGTLVAGNTYEFSYSGRDDALTVESNESVRMTHVPAGANLSVRLSLPFHTDAQVDTLIVYGRDVTAGEPIRRRIGTVANPGAGSATYDVTVNNWSAGVEAPSDHTVPPLLAFGLIWKLRWWARHATVKNRLHFTQIFEAQSWPATFYIDIPLEKGDSIQALLQLGDTLLVFGQSKIFLVFGQTSLDFDVRPAGASQAGALGPRAVDAVEDGAIHASADGIYLFDGATDRLLSDDVDGFAPSAVGWRTYITTATAANLEKTALVYHQAAKDVGIAVTNLYPFGTGGEWILDLNRSRLQDVSAWTTTDRPIGGYIKWDGNEPTAGNRGRLFSWSQTIGTLYEERTGTTADGADLVASYGAPTFSMSRYMTSFVDGIVEVEPHGGTFGIELLVDDRSFGSQTLDISGNVSVYGTAVYGTGTYGGQSRKQIPMTFPLEAEGFSVSLIATYRGREAFRWFTYAMRMMPEPDLSGFGQ
jgi:hypothetical protein